MFMKLFLVSIIIRPQLFEEWITQLVLLVFIRWIVIYPVDSVIYLLNNRGQKIKLSCCVVVSRLLRTADSERENEKCL